MLLRKFSSHNTSEDTLWCPRPFINVYKDTGELEYIEEVEPESIEINGLKWATMNLGAASITDAGDYFQWGLGNRGVSYEYRSSGVIYDRYTEPQGNPYHIKYDPACYHYGYKWRTPSAYEFQQLLANSDSEEFVSNYQDSGVSGLLITYNNPNSSEEDKQLFFPAGGTFYRQFSSQGQVSEEGIGTVGYYWTSSDVYQQPSKAEAFKFEQDGVTLRTTPQYELPIYNGCLIRAVSPA